MTTKKTTKAAAAANADDSNAMVKVDPNLPVVFEDFGDEAGAGIGDAGRDECSIPFLTVLQSNSPQVENNSPEGARAGLMLDTISGELFEGKEAGVLIVPCFRQHAFVEYVPRNQGGGFRGQFAPNDPVVTEAKNRATEYGKYSLENGNELVETFYLYAIRVDETTLEPIGMCVLAFKATGIKKYKAAISKMRYLMVPTTRGKQNPPLYANCLRVKTVGEKNAKGSFFNFEIGFRTGNGLTSLLPPSSAAYQAAKDLADAIGAGKATAAHETAPQDAAPEGGDTSAF